MATLIEKIAEPVSSGSLRLASTDVKLNPIVRKNYFINPMDVERCVNGTRKIGGRAQKQGIDRFQVQKLGSRGVRFLS